MTRRPPRGGWQRVRVEQTRIAPGSDDGSVYNTSPAVRRTALGDAGSSAGEILSWTRDRFIMDSVDLTEQSYLLTNLPRVYAPYVSVNGLELDEVVEYDLSEATLTVFAGTLMTDDVIDVRYAYLGDGENVVDLP